MRSVVQTHHTRAHIERGTASGASRQASLGFSLLAALACLWIGSSGAPAIAARPERPNVLVILTDDQGYGDLGAHGNPKIKTPNLDQFTKESVRLKNFYVSPVCAPTRASLLTGRYNYRTGVVDTYLGRALMHPDEVTLAEMLASAGYRTGIFGKWHLGDNAPLRPIDQGFQEALVIKGGGIGQPSDPLGGSSYFDPVLQHDGKAERYQGYCSDIFAQAAIDFIGRAGDQPFFAYLAFNCPHEPLEAPQPELSQYQSMKLGPGEFPQLGQAIPSEYAQPADSVARVYAMVTNIDTNVGRVLKALDVRGLAVKTIVVFLTDNGPAAVRFNAGLRGWKGSVYDGGIHVPCYVRWPGHLSAGLVVDKIAAHIDIVPTLLEACGVVVPEGLKLDGKSLMPLLLGRQTAGWPERTLYFQWHKGERPELDRAFAARSGQYKLLRHEVVPGAQKPPPLELYDMDHDPLELNNVAGVHANIMAKLHAGYRAWFNDVAGTRGFEPVRIDVGGARENASVLTRQDWRGPRAGWEKNDLGFWEVQIARPGRFEITLHLAPRRFRTVAHIALNGTSRQQALGAGAEECVFRSAPITAGPGRLEAWVEGNRATAGVLDVIVRREGE
jgi:arylsulfatase A-like enzyme